MIIITVVRASGIEWNGKLDSIWEVFWQIIAAEIGLFLTAMTAFRTLFVSRSTERNKRIPKHGSSVWTRSQQLLKRLITFGTWSSSSSKAVPGSSNSERARVAVDFPTIPGGTMTGMRTFIDHEGRTVIRNSSPMHSFVLEEDDEDLWPVLKTPKNQQEQYDLP